MNRTFGYDEFGRMSSSVAGGSGFYATFNPQQDEFGNVTNSSYHYWQNGQTATTFTATYQNNRVTSVSDNGLAQTWNYDAMGNRTGIVKTSDNTTLESIAIDSLGRGVAAGVALDGEGHAVITGGGGNYYIRSSVFGGEIVTTLGNTGNKQEGRVLDGVNLIAEQIGSTVRWHHRDPLNLVARDTEPGQVKRRVHAVTPNGAQIETSEGVDLNQYYGCAAGGYNPNCTGYNPQAAAAYGYLANQANGLLAGGIKVDGALTSRSLSDIARQMQRTGNGSILFSTALFGTPMGASIGVTAGSWQKREVWHEEYSWGKDGFSTTTTAVSETTFEWVPGGEGIGAGSGLIGGQQLAQITERHVALYAEGKDSPAFEQRARQCGGDVRSFDGGKSLIAGLQSLSSGGGISRVSVHSHGAPAGIIGSEQDWRGLYMNYYDHPANIAFQQQRGIHPLNGARGQPLSATAEQLANEILNGSINLGSNAEIVFFACNSDSIASHLEWLLNAGGRGDIRVTGSTNSVYPLSASEGAVDRGYFNTYQNGQFTGAVRTRRYR